MQTVVLFKSKSEEYARACRARGYEPVFVEPLRFDLVRAAELHARLLQPYDALAVTSPRAVDALARCWDPTRLIHWRARRVYAVGEASARQVRALLGLDALGAAAGSADNLAKVIVSDNRNDCKLLFPCGNLSSETLPAALRAAGVVVDSLTVYETSENENLRSVLMELGARETAPRGLVFFSPSGVEYTHRQLQTFSNALFHLPHFAIGDSTALRIQHLGVEVAGVAARPRPDCLLDSILDYFATSKD